MSDKVVFISGASRGIGRETALRFARSGYAVIVGYRESAVGAEETAKECRRLGAPQTFKVRLDLTDDESIRQAAAAVSENFGKIEILINNAGMLISKPLLELGFAEIDQQMRANLFGHIKLTKEFLPLVRKSIVNVGSRLALEPKKNLSVYVACKFGLRGFTQSLAREHPELAIYCVNPAHTATRMGNFSGMDPVKVAEVIFHAATSGYGKPSGSDINVWYYALGRRQKLVYLAKRLIKALIGRRK